MSTGTSASKEYVVVFRAKTAPIFLPGQHLRVRATDHDGVIAITFRTRYLDRGLDHPLPADMWIDARGPAESIENAVSRFGDAAATIIPMIAFSTNGAIGQLQPELAYDGTRGKTQRDFLQVFFPEEGALVQVGRNVPTEACRALMDSVRDHRERERIGRAIEHYRLALDHWRVGYQVLASAHLYIAMENLTESVLRRKLAEGDQSEVDLARHLGVDTKALDPCEHPTLLRAAIRREFLFRGDCDTYQNAKAASDGLEHGYMTFGIIRDKARAVRDLTAKYLRDAVLELVDLDPQVVEQLTSAPYDEPLGSWPVVKYLRGKLDGEGDHLAAPGSAYPIMRWKSIIRNAVMTNDKEIRVTFEEKLSPQLGDGVSFKAGSFEVWRP